MLRIGFVARVAAAELLCVWEFDVALCAMRLPGLNWLDFSSACAAMWAPSRCSPRASADLAHVFQGGEGDEAELQRVCRSVEERAMVRGA